MKENMFQHKIAMSGNENSVFPLFTVTMRSVVLCVSFQQPRLPSKYECENRVQKSQSTILTFAGYDSYDLAQQTPFTQICSTGGQTASGSVLHLMSLDYPTHQPTENYCTCVISIPTDSYGVVKFRDMDYTSDIRRNCSLRVDIPGNFRCAEKGRTSYSDFAVFSEQYPQHNGYFTMHMTFRTTESVLRQRLWLEVLGEFKV